MSSCLTCCIVACAKPCVLSLVHLDLSTKAGFLYSIVRCRPALQLVICFCLFLYITTIIITIIIIIIIHIYILILLLARFSFSFCSFLSLSFLANVNSSSCSLYVIVGPSVVCRLSVVCLSSVTFVRPTQTIEIFRNVSTP